MKVILEAQTACNKTPRGISYYSIQLIRQLLKRRKYEYELTFFDGDRTRNNLQYINNYFSEFDVPVHECNSLDYRIMQSDNSIFAQKSYNDYTGAYGDVFHFMHLISIPANLQGEMVVTIHDLLPVIFPEFFIEGFQSIFELGIKRLNDAKPTVIADSSATKEDVVKFTNIPPENIYVIPLAYDDTKFFPVKNDAILHQLGLEDSPYLLYLGGIDMRKNIVRIIEAFECIAEKFSDIKLVLAGGMDWNANPILSNLNDSKHRSRIVITDYVTDEQKQALYAGATAYLFPSLYEGFGLPVLEAMACGCPVITSNVSSLPEVAGEAALLVDPYNTEQLVHEMERIIISESLREELKCKGFEQCKKFSWDKTAEMTEEVYKIAALTNERGA